MEKIEYIVNRIAENTEIFFNDLKHSHKGYSPEESSAILDEANLDRILSLTKCLSRWVESKSLSEGDLVLGYANIGSIVESWLMLFYAVYYLDYKSDVIGKNKKQYTNKVSNNVNEVTSPNNLRFDFLKQFAYNNILAKNQYNEQELKSMEPCDIKKKKQEVETIRNWIDKVQKKRNAIHSFMKRDVGNSDEFLESIITLEIFVNFILNRMPPFGDCTYQYNF